MAWGGKTIKIAAWLVLLAIAALGVASYVVSRPIGGEALDHDALADHEIAEFERALTFARTVDETGVRLLVVTAWQGGEVAAVDITEAFAAAHRDPVGALAREGFEAIAGVRETGRTRRYSPEALVMPLNLSHPHIGAGTNFKAHAEEAMLDGEPFLFPKLAPATPWYASVEAAPRLDYEAEVCVVALRHITRVELATDALAGALGYLLCNDYTDRYRLIREMDFGAPMGSTGFAGGKGGATHLPIGPLLVVPRDSWGFYQDVRLFLWVNDEQRQRDTASLMVWPPRELLARALDRCADVYEHEGRQLNLTGCDGIAERTLVLTGTPAGVAFKPINLWYSGFYLQPGDEVITTGRYLGMLRNLVVAAD